MFSSSFLPSFLSSLPFFPSLLITKGLKESQKQELYTQTSFISATLVTVRFFLANSCCRVSGE
jgi:hypothetical protein